MSLLTTEIVSTTRRFDQIEPYWHTLWGCTEARAPLSFEWCREWWRHFGDRYAQPDGLRIIAIWAQDSNAGAARLVSLLPLYYARKKLGHPRVLASISTGEVPRESTCAEHLGGLYDPAWGDHAVAAVFTALSDRTQLQWDTLSFGVVGNDSPVTRYACSRSYFTLERSATHQAPFADLSGGFESYLERLSGQTRQNFRRLIRQGEQAGIIFELADTHERAKDALESLVSLHQRRWIANQMSGAFSSSRVVGFHHRLVTALLPRGIAMLATLRAKDGEPHALLYGFRHGGVFEFYQSGINISDSPPVKSPGVLAHLLLMRQLAENSVHTYDLLAGTSDYKARLATGTRSLSELTVLRPSIPTAIAAVSRLAGKLYDRLRKSQARGARTPKGSASTALYPQP